MTERLRMAETSLPACHAKLGYINAIDNSRAFTVHFIYISLSLTLSHFVHALGSTKCLRYEESILYITAHCRNERQCFMRISLDALKCRAHVNYKCNIMKKLMSNNR